MNELKGRILYFVTLSPASSTSLGSVVLFLPALLNISLAFPLDALAGAFDDVDMKLLA